jgi:hypothetical protein
MRTLEKKDTSYEDCKNTNKNTRGTIDKYESYMMDRERQYVFITLIYNL